MPLQVKESFLEHSTILGQTVSLLLLLIGYSFKVILWARVFLLLLFFLPGWVIITLVDDLINKIRFQSEEIILISFCLSLFFDFIFWLLLRIYHLFSHFILIFLFLFGFLILLRFVLKQFFLPLIGTREKDISFVVPILMICFFLFLLCSRNLVYIHSPDEYSYLRTLMNDNLQRFTQFHEMQRMVFYLLLDMFFCLTTPNFLNGALFAICFYTMLIPTSYSLGSLYSKKCGLVSSIFTFLNPPLFYWANRVMPDIPVTVLTLASVYFYLKMWEEKTNTKPYMIMFFISFLLALLIKVNVMVLGVPILLYSFLYLLTEKKSPKLLIGLLATCLTLTVIPIFGMYNFGFFSYDIPHILEYASSFLQYSISDWQGFLLKGSGYRMWIDPYLFTHPIILLSIIGLITLFTQKNWQKRRYGLFFLSMILLYFWVAPYLRAIRHSFPAYPMITMLAAIGFLAAPKYTRRAAPIIIPLIVFYFLLPVPSNCFFGDVSGAFLWVSKYFGVFILTYKLIEEEIHRNFHKIPHTLKSLQNFKIKQLTSGIALLVIIVTSFWYSHYGAHYTRWRGDNAPPENARLPEVAGYINTHILSNGSIVTNIAPNTLSYYVNPRVTAPPHTEKAFSTAVKEKKIDALVLYRWDPLQWQRHLHPYLQKYFHEETSPTYMQEVKRMTRKDNDWHRVVIYQRKPNLPEPPENKILEKTTEWEDTHKYRRKVRINTSSIEEELTNITFPIKMTGQILDFINFEKNHLQFYDKNGTRLPHEIVRWNTSKNEAFLWVRVPKLSPNQENYIWIYYGGGKERIEDKNTTWGEHSIMVHHLEEYVGTRINDSTRYQNDGIIHGARWIPTRWDSGLSFKGDDSVRIPHTPCLNVSQAFTIDLLAKLNKKEVEHGSLLCKGAKDFQLLRNRNVIEFVTRNIVGDLNRAPRINSEQWSVGEWLHITAVWNETTGRKRLYLNGSLIDSTRAKNIGSSTNDLFIGRAIHNTEFLNGQIDYIHLYNTSQSETWVKMRESTLSHTLVSFGAREKRSPKIEDLQARLKEQQLEINATVREPAGRKAIQSVNVTIIDAKRNTLIENKSMSLVENVEKGYKYAYSYTYDESTERGFKVIVYAKNNISSYSSTVTVAGDDSPPQITIISPEEDSYINSSWFTVTWEGEDEWGISSYAISIDKGKWIRLKTSNYTFTTVEEGTHIIEIISTDLGGNTNISSVNCTVDITPPSISITYPKTTIQIQQPTLTIRWRGADHLTGISKPYSIRIDNTSLMRIKDNEEYTVSGVEDGCHSVLISTIDRAGNIGEAMITFIRHSPPHLDVRTSLLVGIIITPLLVIFATARIEQYFWEKKCLLFFREKLEFLKHRTRVNNT